MNTTAVLADKMKALAQTLARAHRNMNGWYAVDVQTAATDVKRWTSPSPARRRRADLDRRRGQ
jgi:hypothetical protein